MSRLEELIDEGEGLISEDYDSPLVDIWQNDVKAEVAKYGAETSKVLERAFWFGSMIQSDEHGQQMHREMIAKVQKLLRSLDARSPDDMQAQSVIINQKQSEAKASLGAKLGNAITVNGNATFGDNSPINNIQVGEILSAIISEAESKLPEGEEKKKVLNALKSVLANPTFAAIAGTLLPEAIKGLLK